MIKCVEHVIERLLLEVFIHFYNNKSYFLYFFLNCMYNFQNQEI
jgi:hypothetical protein